MTRREFLPAVAATMGAEARVKVAFLGASHAHAAAKIKVVQQSARFELVGAAEDDARARAACEKAGVRLLAREALLGDRGIQLVVVESQNRDHARDALAALDAGKHVAVEKPPAENLADVRRMVKLAVEKKRVLRVGYMWRYNPAMTAAIEAARRGWLGEVYLVRASMNTLLGAEERRAWAANPGGHMFELGCHMVDAMVRLLGRPEKVTPFLRHDGAFEDSLRDNTAAVLEWRRALGVVTGSSMQPNGFARRSFEICGTAGTAVVGPVEPPVLTLDLAQAAGPYARGAQTLRMGPHDRHAKEFDARAAQLELDVQETLLRASAMRI